MGDFYLLDQITNTHHENTPPGGPGATGSPLFVPVPTQTLGAIPLQGSIGKNQLANITLVNSGTVDATLTIQDSVTSKDHTYTIAAGAPVLIKKAVVFGWKLEGAGATITGVFSWPEEVPPESIFIAGQTSVAISSNGGSSVPTTTSGPLSFPGGGQTAVFGVSPPAGLRWRLWGIGVILNNTGGVGYTASAVGIQVYRTNGGSGIGADWSKSETWTLTPATASAWVLGPTGITNATGTFVNSDVISLLPMELIVEPGMTVQGTATLNIGGINGTGTMQIVPLGVEEPL